MRELTGHIRLMPVKATLPGDYATAGYCDVMAEHFDFEPVFSDDQGGVNWQCDKTFVIENPDDVLLQFFSIPRSCLVTFFDNTGGSFCLGSRTVPLRVTMSRHLQLSQLQLQGRVVENPFDN